MRLTLRDLEQLKPRSIRNGDRLQGTIAGVSTDSRSVSAGELFVALRGEKFDGHRFLAEAAARGASALVAEASGLTDDLPHVPIVVVEDSTKALGALARNYRDRFAIPVLAVAGSNGKTTTKEMIREVLGAQNTVLCTEGNHNNQIGVPQTLFRLEKKHDLAVVEIGTNHPGELGLLCDILNPTHGLITNIGPEHLEFFGTLDGVAKEEGALFEFLAARRGTAFVNNDDSRVAVLARQCRNRVTFGFSGRRASVRGKRLRLNGDARASFAFIGGRLRKPATVQLKTPGRHQANNALAAAAVGVAFGVPARDIVKKLEAFTATDRRMEVLMIAGVTVLNDTYNANPESTVAALQTLAALRVKGKRIAVLADMLELGTAEAVEHRRVGETAAALGLDYVLTYGQRAKWIHGAIAAGFAAHYDQKNVLAEYLAELVSPGDAVLLKGSRGMMMEDLVTFLTQRLPVAASKER